MVKNVHYHETESYSLKQLTNRPPANKDHFVEFEWKQIVCSPGVWDVKVNLPSAEKYLDITTFSLGSCTSTCMPIPGLDGRNVLLPSSNN